MQQIIHLICGDISGDGHNKTSDYFIKSNLHTDEIEKAFKKGTELLGFNIQDVCDSFEENELSQDQVNKLYKFGFDKEYYEIADCLSAEYFVIGEDEYFDIYLFTVKLGNPDFEFEMIDFPRIDIGGYGVF